MKIVNNFVWKIVTDKAKDIYNCGLFELFVLYEDGSESLIDSYKQLTEHLENGLEIAIEVGFLKSSEDTLNLYTKDKFTKHDNELINSAIDNYIIDTDDIKDHWKDWVINKYSKNLNEEVEDYLLMFDEHYDNGLTHEQNFEKFLNYMKNETN